MGRRKVDSMDPVRLLLIDDHLMVTEALASRLSEAADIWVAGRCTTVDPSLLDIVREGAAGCHHDRGGAAWPGRWRDAARLVATRPEAHVVVLSSDHTTAHAVEAARAGVSAWVAKEQDAAVLETVIRGVVKGRSWFPPEMLGEILPRLREDVCRAREHDDLLSLLSPAGTRRATAYDGGQTRPADSPGPDDLARHCTDPHT